MSNVSEQLRQAREGQKLTLQQVVEITKIRTDHLRALEEGNFGVFSAPVYVKGFVRTYATLLKLDVPKMMAELEAELSQSQKFSEPPPLMGEPKGIADFLMLQLSKLDWRTGVIGIVVVLLGVVIISAALIWRHQRTADP